MIKKFFKNEKGTTTIEFAVIFPLVFFICFFCILLLFRIGDGMILHYEASRLSRLESTGVTLKKTDPYYNDLVEFPTLNVFTEKEISSSTTEEDNIDFLTTSVVVSEPKVPPLLTSLSLLELGETNPDEYSTLSSSSIRIKEPYFPLPSS
jgi:hypothetical protein